MSYDSSFSVKLRIRKKNWFKKQIPSKIAIQLSWYSNKLVSILQIIFLEPIEKKSKFQS